MKSEENGYLAYYAVSQDVVYQNKLHEEILWCEMKVLDDGRIQIRWEDSWSKPEYQPDLPSAKVYVSRHFLRHKGHENGRAYDV